MTKQSSDTTPWQRLKPNEQTMVILFWLTGLAIIMGLFSSLENGTRNWRNLVSNLSTELLGASFTFVIFNYVTDKRDKENLRDSLIRNMRSYDNGFALRASEELRAFKWLTDGSLNEKVLYLANLEGANLWRASLISTDLGEAKLQNSALREAKLNKANLWRANLQNANLYRADLEGADLREANLAGTNLSEANLANAKILKAKFDNTTILPDGSQFKQNIDISRFVNPKHPNFWRSDKMYSPAFQDKLEENKD